MNIYKNDPKYKPNYKKDLCQKINFNIQVENTKSARTTKTQNHTFCKFLKS